MLQIAPVIQVETDRHAKINNAISEFKTGMVNQLQIYDDRFRELEAQRLDERNFNKKDEITELLARHDELNPRKWLKPFTNDDSPYFGIVGIHDEDKKIGIKEYVFGKQGLIGSDNKSHIIDWRNPVAVLYYNKYDDNEDYEIEIPLKDKTIERTGIVTHTHMVTISKKELLNIETRSETYKCTNGKWITKDGKEISGPVSAEIKTDTGNHQLIDIVALISAEQFKSITKQFTGCTYLTGGAGSGKTTIALHRLSYLQFNEPKYFDPEKCLVLVFNRTLKDYVKATSTELLGTTAIDTFTSWGIAALKHFGCKAINFTADMNGFDEIKKHAAIEFLLNMYVNSGKSNESSYDDLMHFYGSEIFTSYFFKDDADETKMIKFTQHHNHNDNKLAFSDVGIMLRLCQLRNKAIEIKNAFNYYDHIVADEAQDFAQHELEAIFAALNERKSLTICADEKQKILSFVDANGLTNFKAELHTIGLDKTTFTVGYRSAPEIMDVANIVAGKQDKSNYQGKLIEYKHLDINNVVSYRSRSKKEAVINELIDTVVNYQKEDKLSLTAIICKSKQEVQYIHTVLTNFMKENDNAIINLHPAGTIAFTPGIIITNAHQVKGLEFTNVILWNPSYRAYRKTEEDRNLLYVAISRACKKLAVIHYESLSSWFGK